MCYNNCQYHDYNQYVGTDRCTRGDAPCPDEEVEVEEEQEHDCNA